MLIKATRLHPPGVPLQVYMEGMAVAEVVVEGMVEVESAVVELKMVVVGMSEVVVVESDMVVSVDKVVKATMAAIAALAIS